MKIYLEGLNIFSGLVEAKKKKNERMTETPCEKRSKEEIQEIHGTCLVNARDNSRSKMVASQWV